MVVADGIACCCVWRRFCWCLRGIAVLLRVWCFTGTDFCMLRSGLLGLEWFPDGFAGCWFDCW